MSIRPFDKREIPDHEREIFDEKVLMRTYNLGVLVTRRRSTGERAVTIRRSLRDGRVREIVLFACDLEAVSAALQMGVSEIEAEGGTFRPRRGE